MRMTDAGVEDRRPSGSRWPLSLTALLALLPLAGCGNVKLESKFRDRPITVDGKPDEWQDSMTFLRGPGIAVGLFNDENDLYVCITSWNQEVNLQAVNMGLTVWFDPGGGEETTFGIEYPLMEDRFHRQDRGAQGSGATAPERPTARLAVRGPGPFEGRVMAVAEAPGIEVMVATVNGAFVYELKLPLKKSDQHPYAIGADPGQVVGVRLETTTVASIREEPRNGGGPRGGGRGGGMGGGMGGGVRGGMGGHRHGGMGGGTRGGGSGGGDGNQARPKIPKPLKVTVKVHLAPTRSGPSI